MVREPGELTKRRRAALVKKLMRSEPGEQLFAAARVFAQTTLADGSLYCEGKLTKAEFVRRQDAALLDAVASGQRERVAA